MRDAVWRSSEPASSVVFSRRRDCAASDLVERARIAGQCAGASATHGQTAARARPRGAGPALRGVCVSASEHQRALDFLDRLGDLDATGAGVGAVEGGAATPHAFLVVEDVQTLGGTFVAASRR